MDNDYKFYSVPASQRLLRSNCCIFSIAVLCSKMPQGPEILESAGVQVRLGCHASFLVPWTLLLWNIFHPMSRNNWNQQTQGSNWWTSGWTNEWSHFSLGFLRKIKPRYIFQGLSLKLPVGWTKEPKKMQLTRDDSSHDTISADRFILCCLDGEATIHQGFWSRRGGPFFWSLFSSTFNWTWLLLITGNLYGILCIFFCFFLGERHTTSVFFG